MQSSMKTPKQILLESHRDVEPQLDRLREDVLAAEFSATNRAQQVCAPTPSQNAFCRGAVLLRPRNRAASFAAALLQKLWLELIWPSRRAWAGLAAVWVGLAAVYLATQRPGNPKLPPPNAQMVAAWVQEQQLLAQLLDHPQALSLSKGRPSSAHPEPARSEPVEPVEGPPNKSAQWLADDKTAWV